jgi:hypothetical protein
MLRVYTLLNIQGDLKVVPHFLTPGKSEAEFLDVIGTKVLRVFLLAIHSHLY